MKRALTEVMTDGPPSLRAEFAKRIGELGPGGRDLAPVLQKIVRDPDRKVADAAAAALQRLGVSETERKDEP